MNVPASPWDMPHDAVPRERVVDEPERHQADEQARPIVTRFGDAVLRWRAPRQRQHETDSKTCFSRFPIAFGG